MSRPTEPGASPRRIRRLPLWLTIAVVIAAAAWTAIWSTARARILDEVDRQLVLLQGRGVAIACADRRIGGFPFRMELACNQPGLTIAGRGVSASAAGLRVVAQVWDPRLLIVEIDGPGLGADGRGGLFAGSWRTLQVSLRWDGSGPQRVSLAADGLDLTVTPTGQPAVHVIAEHAELHGRPSGAEGHDFDLAASFVAAALDLAGKRVGPPKADFALSTTLVSFLPPGPGDAAVMFAARGGRAEPTRLTLAVGGVTVEGNGKLVLGADGVLDGMITLAARGLEHLATGGAKGLGPELTTALSGFVLLGKPSNDPALPGRRLEMIVDHGSVRIARLMLGRIPPLFGAGS